MQTVDQIIEFGSTMGFNSFEGDSGVRKFTRLMTAVTLGQYSSIESFLADNPIAVEALIDALAKVVDGCPDMKSALDEATEDEDDDEGDDE